METELETVVERLEGAGIAYMVTGSFAMNFYATPRMTRDIDFVVELDRNDIQPLTRLFDRDFLLSSAQSRT